MANNQSLDEISVAIGRLQSSQEATASSLSAHMLQSINQNTTLTNKVEELNAALVTSISELKESIDGKIEKKMTHLLSGGVGGVLAAAVEYLSQFVGIKFPGGH